MFVVPTYLDYKICYCDNCPILGQRLTFQLRPLINNVSESSSCSYSQATKQFNLKNSSLKLFNKKHKLKNPKNTPTRIGLQIDFVLLHTYSRLHSTPQSVISYPPIKVERKYTKRKHNSNNTE